MSSHNDSFAESGSSPTQRAAKPSADFIVENHGSILLLRPQNEQAIAWVHEHIGSDNGFQPYWPVVVIEPRYVRPILEGIAADGLLAVSA